MIIAFWGICIWQIKKAHPTLNLFNQYYFREFFSGLKNWTSARLYILIFLSQRVLGCLLVIFLADVSLTAILSILTIVQISCIVYLWKFSPYEYARNTFTECISQLNMALFSWALIYYNSVERWNSIINWTLVSILFASTTLITVTSLIDLFVQISKKFTECLWNESNHVKFESINNFTYPQRETSTPSINPIRNSIPSKIEEAKEKSTITNKINGL